MSIKKIITNNPFRGSFVHLTEPALPHGETDEAKARYQITIVLPKNDPFWKLVSAQIEEAAKEKWGKVPATLKRPVKDGDALVDDDGNLKYPEFEAAYTLQASTKRRPDVADAQLQKILKAEDLYSGATYRAAVRAYAWSHPTGGKGVSFSLETVMKVADGEPLEGGGGIASEDFAKFAEQETAEGEPSADSLLG